MCIRDRVCGSITRVRLQVGWQEEHPIVVACGKCGTSLSGNVKIGQDRPGLKFSFDNADEIPDAEADYMVECSGEFPTVKQGKAAELEEVVITPFIRYMNRMKTDDSYEMCIRDRFTTDPKRMAQSNDVLMSVRAPVGDLNVAYEPCCIGRGLGAIRSKDNHQSFVLYTCLLYTSRCV